MGNFVITGKASTVFRIIELAAKREEAAKTLEQEIKKSDAELNQQSFKLRQLNHMYEPEHRRGEPCPHNKAIISCRVYPCLGRACQPGKERN